MNKSLRLLVTGGCGYVGTVLVEQLLSFGHHVTVVDTQWFGNKLAPNLNLVNHKCDVRDIEPGLLEGIDSIVHLANIANDPSVELNPTLSWEVNVLGTMQLVDMASRVGVPHFIYASTGSVYGIRSEDRVTEDLPLVPLSVYNKTKMVAERVLLSYSNQLQVHCIRPATVCGVSPRMRLDVSVNMFTKQAFVNNKMTVFGGAQTRPNIHIEDLSNVYLHFLGHPEIESGCYNAGFENISIHDIATLVADRTGAEITVGESNDLRSYRQDSSKLLATGFSQKKSVAIAIDEMLAGWKNGSLVDSEDAYTVQHMKRLGLGDVA